MIFDLGNNTRTATTGDTRSGWVYIENDGTATDITNIQWVTPEPSIEDIKKWLEARGTYTTEDIKTLLRGLELVIHTRCNELERKVQCLEETNSKILEKLNFLCERKKRASNLRYSLDKRD